VVPKTLGPGGPRLVPIAGAARLARAPRFRARKLSTSRATASRSKAQSLPHTARRTVGAPTSKEVKVGVITVPSFYQDYGKTISSRAGARITASTRANVQRLIGEAPAQRGAEH